MTITRFAYVAREPGIPGAVAYINLDCAHRKQAQEFMRDWIDQGAQISLVHLHQAIKEFSQYCALKIATSTADLPSLFRKQAD